MGHYILYKLIGKFLQVKEVLKERHYSGTVVINIKGAASLDRQVEKAKIEVVRVLFDALTGLGKLLRAFLTF